MCVDSPWGSKGNEERRDGERAEGEGEWREGGCHKTHIALKKAAVELLKHSFKNARVIGLKLDDLSSWPHRTLLIEEGDERREKRGEERRGSG